MKRQTWVLLFLALTLLHRVEGADKIRLAILPLAPLSGVEPWLAESLTDLLVGEFKKESRFEVMPPSEVLSFGRKEFDSNQSFSSPSTAMALGRSIQTHKIVIGSVTRVGSTHTIDLQFLDIPSKSFQSSYLVEASITDLGTPLRKVIKDFFDKNPPTGTVVQLKPLSRDVYVNLNPNDGAKPGRLIALYAPLLNEKGVQTNATWATTNQYLGQGRIKSVSDRSVSVIEMLGGTRPARLGDKVLFDSGELKAEVAAPAPQARLASPPTPASRPAQPLAEPVKRNLFIFGGTALAATGLLVAGALIYADADAQKGTYLNTYQSSEATALGDRITQATQTADIFYTASEGTFLISAIFGVITIVEAIRHPRSRTGGAPNLNFGCQYSKNKNALAFSVNYRF